MTEIADSINILLEGQLGSTDLDEVSLHFIDTLCLVLQDGQPVGFFNLARMARCIEELLELLDPDLELELLFGDRMYENLVSRITFPNIVSADFSLLDAAQLLSSKHGYLFILEGEKITGYITYKDIFRLPGVLCIFALMIELEAACLNLCHAFAEQCWSALSQTRKDKAVEVWKKRVAHPKEMDELSQRVELHGAKALTDSFIECTMFIDKAKMIGKCKLLIDWGRDKLDSIFNRAEQVRNACAHPAEIGRLESILPRERFGDFLRNCRQLIESIRTVTPRETPSSSSES
jgi:hypothetical protein